MSEETFKPSKNAAMMLAQMHDMSDDELEWFNDMAMGIASTMEDLTAQIENPPKKRVKGCEVIHLGAELFLPMRNLKQKLENGGLELEDYVSELDQIVDRLSFVVTENQKVLSNPKVRSHMKQLANAVVLHLEAGPVLNNMFGILNQEQ